ncbi:MAG: prephenate dehydrogenase/arogenate dehydrogenase family protein [Candidatus Lokiarchaeota archaeon]|nr:prephenate dehydrogenase/arogenate dehydrogenase family protein [Candidatus Lokiarchaeota archaeon]MBD3200599.1 prephenate dehydrogenase/arogenate dehydrogenase family protein [Candidatus Lokiarchaeota archaeon]
MIMLGNKITIIGGSGGIGQVFAKLFKNHGFEITLVARNQEKLKKVAKSLDVLFQTDLKESVADADIVMVTIPIETTPNMIEYVAPYMKKDALIFDVTSLKEKVYQSLKKVQKTYPINSVSLHPMFGPGIQKFQNYVMIMLKVGGTKSYDRKMQSLKKLFESEGLIIRVVLDPSYHDKIMALVLGVPHMFNILFIDLLRNAQIPLSELTKFTGTTFLLQKVFAESIIQREVHMFGEIQMNNSEFHKILDSFHKLLTEYRNIIKNNHMNKFETIFSDGIEYSSKDSHFKRSYNYFYDFMKILKEKKYEEKPDL